MEWRLDYVFSHSYRGLQLLQQQNPRLGSGYIQHAGIRYRLLVLPLPCPRFRTWTRLGFIPIFCLIALFRGAQIIEPL